MEIKKILETKIKEFLSHQYDTKIEELEFSATRKDFEGDVTIIIFPLLRFVKTSPDALGNAIGTYLTDELPQVTGYNVVKGFLNIVLSDSHFIDYIMALQTESEYKAYTPIPSDKSMLIEYSSPNTNKPLHLGHIRNNLLGSAISEIYEATGHQVYRTQIINDRGIHICKSMLAWQHYGNGETPESSGLKGDKLVGKYYVLFDKEYRKQIKECISQGMDKETAPQKAPLMVEAKQMLIQWENKDSEIRALWQKMNSWVYAGFAKTYEKLGVHFDKEYFESDTYLLGKDHIYEGLEKGVFYKKEDGSIWIDLTDEGLDEKIVLRSDQTAVYMTQDIGTAIQRTLDFEDVSGMIYTVGNEQDYHFKVLFLILKKLGFSWAGNLYHLSYGMVDLPEGKMKSREGTVVDADDLIDQIVLTSKQLTEKLGKVDHYTTPQKEELYHTIALGALKYYILKVDPKKRILFNPEESIDFNGNTGPFIQYSYARIQSLLSKAKESQKTYSTDIALEPTEKEIIKQLTLLPEVMNDTVTTNSPALVANYTYDLVKVFNSFYQNVNILSAEDTNTVVFRTELCRTVGVNIKFCFNLLGIKVPDRM